MRAFTLAVLVAAGCSDSGDVDYELCDSYAASDSQCVTDENLEQCRAAVRECGDDVLILESCPLQFDCP